MSDYHHDYNNFLHTIKPKHDVIEILKGLLEWRFMISWAATRPDGHFFVYKECKLKPAIKYYYEYLDQYLEWRDNLD